MKNTHLLELDVTTYFLSMEKPSILKEPDTPENIKLTYLTHKTPEFCQFLFLRVGGPFRWYSRMGWNYQEWKAHLASELVHIYVAEVGGAPIGYFELIFDEAKQSAELKFIGLMPTAIGKGYGRWLLNTAIYKSFTTYDTCLKLWLHTCSEDHPSALQNYVKRGFVLEREETAKETIPNYNDALWLGGEFTSSYLTFFAKSNEK